ncbi:MAG TPA: hypothetical protein VGF76_18875 [Polyangiaceae bacterium]
MAPALLADSEANLNGWFAFVDAVQTEVVAAHPGADNTNTAVEFRGGHAVSSGMGWGLFCSDVSRYSGVSFWAKGRGGDHIRFQVAVPATDGQPGRGDCLAECNDHPGESLVLTNAWKQYTVHWDELHQEGWGARGNFAGIANSLLWINDGAVDSFDFEVDQVSLVK